MKSILKMLGLAVFLGLGVSAAQAGGYAGDEREFYYRQPNFNHNCFDYPRHPACSPRHPRPGIYVQPGIHLEFQFGNVHTRRHDYDRPIIRKVRLCTNGMAVDKARSIGIRHIRAYAYRDHILIKGKKRGHRVNVAFSRQWGCPVIGW